LFSSEGYPQKEHKGIKNCLQANFCNIKDIERAGTGKEFLWWKDSKPFTKPETFRYGSNNLRYRDIGANSALYHKRQDRKNHSGIGQVVCYRAEACRRMQNGRMMIIH
jgi:hypothetical protein